MRTPPTPCQALAIAADDESNSFTLSTMYQNPSHYTSVEIFPQAQPVPIPHKKMCNIQQLIMHFKELHQQVVLCNKLIQLYCSPTSDRQMGKNEKRESEKNDGMRWWRYDEAIVCKQANKRKSFMQSWAVGALRWPWTWSHWMSSILLLSLVRTLRRLCSKRNGIHAQAQRSPWQQQQVYILHSKSIYFINKNLEHFFRDVLASGSSREQRNLSTIHLEKNLQFGST